MIPMTMLGRQPRPVAPPTSAPEIAPAKKPTTIHPMKFISSMGQILAWRRGRPRTLRPGTPRTAATTWSGCVWWAAWRAPSMMTTRPSASRSSSANGRVAENGHALAAEELEDRLADDAQPVERGGRVRLGLEFAQDRAGGGRAGRARSGRPGRRRGRRRSCRRPRSGTWRARHRGRRRPAAPGGGPRHPGVIARPGGVGAPSYEITRRIASVSSAAPSAQRPPYECPNTSTGSPPAAASVSATAATSSNSRSIEYGPAASPEAPRPRRSIAWTVNDSPSIGPTTRNAV